MSTPSAISLSPSDESSLSAASSIHRYCIQGDLPSLQTLLTSHGEEGSRLLYVRDGNGRLPIHNALMYANIDCVQAILSLDQEIDDYRTWPAGHLSLALAGFGAYRDDCCACLRALISSHVDLTRCDHHNRTVLHLACTVNLSSILPALLPLVDIQATDKDGLTALNYAIDSDAGHCVTLLLQETGLSARLMQDQDGDSLMHRAVRKGRWRAAQALQDYLGTDVVNDRNKAGQTSQELAELVGFASDFSLFSSGTLPSNPRKYQTLIVTHPVCRQHGSLPAAYSSDSELRLYQTEFQPENPQRYEVLLQQPNGALLMDEFAESLLWIWDPPPVCIADIMRVHDYGYVMQVKRLCQDLEPSLGGVMLDRDTVVSAESYEAALRAAGAVIVAIDEVVSGHCRNSFCPIRPPGHHIGPSGLVRSPDSDDPGSTGFCLFNNVAIGAAYALSVLRDTIHKVAIVDFDVHHGNGTEAIISTLYPASHHSSHQALNLNLTFTTSKYRPWVDENDPQNVLFISTHGYGEHFYPGSGVKSSDVAEGYGGIVNLPFPADTLSSDFRRSKGLHSVQRPRVPAPTPVSTGFIADFRRF